MSTILNSNGKSNSDSNAKYLNTTRSNYLNWKRHIDGTLAAHPNKLLSVVQDGLLSKTYELKLKQSYLAIKEDFDTAAKTAHLTELRTEAYYIMLPTIGDNTTVKHIENNFDADKNAFKLYAYINDQWAVDKDDDERHLEKDAERAQLVKDGAQSGSFAHIDAFVESLLSLNDELKGTEFHWGDTVITTRVLDAIQVHNQAFVSALKGSKIGDADWKKDFGKLWSGASGLRRALEAQDTSPLTGEPLSSKALLPNHLARASCQRYREEHADVSNLLSTTSLVAI